jgi:murein DD-endopeptidase MepM/ murein hydrolase activator NlpD
MIANLLRKFQHIYHAVIPFNKANDKLLAMDFTATNKTLTSEIFDDTEKFSSYINTQLKNANALYGIGGYNENRAIYSRSKHFDSVLNKEPRRIHLGIDIWGKEGTPVSAPLGGMVHSFAYNDRFGDYGATIVLLHQLDGIPFYTLYGHLSLKDIATLKDGEYISIGQKFAHFGNTKENGNWPPHLHFQVIENMELKKGDYPGVCTITEREKYLSNCTDPDFILNMMQYAEPMH